MIQPDDIDLNGVIPALRRGVATSLEFYEANGPTSIPSTQLAADVASAASRLGRLGLRPRARVGIVGSTSYRWIVSDLACLTKGYFTVPLDPDAGWDHSRLMEKFALDIVLTDRPACVGSSFATFDSICEGPGGDDPAELPAVWDQDEPFTVIFSSGTSGEPKAIEVRKRCFDDQFSNALRMFSITADDKMLVFLPMHVYLERCYVYLAILSGFSVTVASPRFVARALRSSGFAFTVGVPHFFVMLHQLFATQVRAHALGRAICAVRLWLFRLGLGGLVRRPFGPFLQMLGGKARFLLTGSAPCPVATLRFFEAMGVPLYEGYGMSEIAGMVALNYPGHSRIGTVGKVFPNKDVKLDEDGQILVRGENAANTGYWRVPPEVNAETFLANGWVATGDIGRFDRDGYLTIEGRIKDVIVLSNGRKVHPATVEAQIEATTSSVDRAVVIGDNRPYLVALVCLKASGADSEKFEEEFRRFNASRPDAEKVQRYSVMTDPFTVENGLLSRAFKLNRRVVQQRYATIIADLYAS